MYTESHGLSQGSRVLSGYRSDIVSFSQDPIWPIFWTGSFLKFLLCMDRHYKNPGLAAKTSALISVVKGFLYKGSRFNT